MYNEYPDLIYEGLMYDLNIVTEAADTENKNIFQKFIAFLKRIGQWFVKIFKKITEKIKGIKSGGELTDEELSKITVTNYNIPLIEKFINSYETIFEKIDDIIDTRTELGVDTYNQQEIIQKYTKQVTDIYDNKENTIITSKDSKQKFANSMKDKTNCTKKIYDFMVDTYKIVRDSNINKISDRYRKRFSAFNVHSTYASFLEITSNDKKIITVCTNTMNMSHALLDQIFTDLVSIYNGVNIIHKRRVYDPGELSSVYTD